jgi:hypothetical protein
MGAEDGRKAPAVTTMLAKIDAVLCSESRQRELAAKLTGSARQFSTERFMQEFRGIVEGFAARSGKRFST